MEPSEFTLQHPCGISISAELRESDVPPEIRLSRDDMGNGYVWYDLPDSEIEGECVSCRICFHNSVIESADFSVDLDDDSGGWDDWSEQKEKLRAARTGKWLTSLGYAPGEYQWGNVWAMFHPKSGEGGGGVHFGQDQ